MAQSVVGVATELLALGNGAWPIEPFALALALGFELGPMAAGDPRVVGETLFYAAVGGVTQQQHAVLIGVAGWALERAGLPQDYESITLVCSNLGHSVDPMFCRDSDDRLRA